VNSAFSLPRFRLPPLLANRTAPWVVAYVIGSILLALLAVVTGTYLLVAGVLCACLAAPFVTSIDGMPTVVAVAALPLSSFFDQYGSGIGGYKLVALFCAACWVTGFLARWQTIRFRTIALDYAVAGLFFVAILNIMFLSDQGKVGLLQWYAGDLLLYLWVRSTTYDARQLHRVILGFACMAMFAAVLGFWLYGAGLAPVSEGLTRLDLPGQNINGVGAIMLVAAGIALSLIVFETRPLVRIGLGAVLAATAFAVVLTFSRGAFVGVVAMLAAGLAVSHSWRIRAASLAAAGVAVGTVWSGIASSAGLSSYVARVTALTSLNYTTTGQRNVLWSMGWKAFTTHWLFGLGIGNFYLQQFWFPLAYQFAAPRGFFFFPQAVHSFYIGWLSDAGVCGGIFLVATLLIAVGTLFRSTLMARGVPHLSGLSYAVFISFTGFFVYAASSPEQDNQLPYVIIALAGCLWSVIRSVTDVADSEWQNRDEMT
jgi:hypothetical protein